MSRQPEQQSTILLLEEDDQTRPLLKRNLQSYGYRVVVAFDEEDALERVSDGSLQADLILVDVVGTSSEDALDRGRRIREHGKYNGHTPLVLMAERFGRDLEGTDVNVGGNDWITYLEDHDQLKNLLARLIHQTST